jgi:hypothetical protein
MAMDDAAKLSVLEQVAGMARARVADALKSTVEHEVMEQEMAMEDVPSRHSKFEHVVAEISNIAEAQHADRVLAASMWNADTDGRIMEFAERLVRGSTVQAQS